MTVKGPQQEHVDSPLEPCSGVCSVGFPQNNEAAEQYSLLLMPARMHEAAYHHASHVVPRE